MALIIPNIGMSALLNPGTQQLEAAFTKMESIVLDVDSKLQEVYGGPGAYSVINIMADRKPKVTIKGPELPLTAAAGLLGANATVASSGSPVQIPLVEEYTISAAGTVTLNSPVSATATQISVIGALDGKPFTGVASAPTSGQYANPSAGATSVIFSTNDAGKPVIILYNTDSTTGGEIDIMPTSMPGVHKFIASAKVVNTEDPNKALVPITFIVNACQFIGNWQISQERQKASATSLDLSILDPGGGKPAITIVTAAKFAG
jgi:hypothetical protein